MRSNFVGRRRELDILLERLTDSLARRGNFCLITGSAGVGKSRLMEELAADARSRGALVLWARSFADLPTPAYWPWTLVLRALLNVGQLSSLPSARSTISAVQLIPELRLGLSTESAGHTSSAREAIAVNEAEPDVQHVRRFRLFDSVATIIREAAVTTPLVLALDDLQDFDPDSLLLLQFIVTQIRSDPILVIGSSRQSGIGAASRTLELINAVAREGTSVQLLGLQEPEIADFVAMTTGEPADVDLVRVLQRHTEGNPFHLEETLRAGNQHRSLKATNVPQGVRFTVQLRLEPLRPPVRDLLRIASVIGCEFDVRLLNAVARAPLDESLSLLSEALEHGLITQVPNAGHRYRFTQGLFAETIYHALPKNEAIRVHSLVAQALEKLYGGDLQPHFAQLAYHYTQALPIASAAKALHFCKEAAARARKSCAFEDAMQLYQSALNALELMPSPVPGAKFDILALLGEVSFAAGLFAESRQYFHDAAEIARSTSDEKGFARAILGLAAAPTESGTINHERVRQLKGALRVFGERDDALRARLMAKLAWEVYWSESTEVTDSLSATAVEIANRLKDDEALTEILFHRHHAIWSPDNLEERLAITIELLKLSDTPERTLGAMRGHYLRIADLLEMGDNLNARIELEKYSSISNESGFTIGYGELALATCCLVEGKLEEGERWADEALRIGLRQQLRARRHREANAFYMLSLRREQGRSSEMESLAQKLSKNGRAPLIRALLAVYYAEVGNISYAKSEFDRLVAGGLGRIRRDSIWLATMTLASSASVHLNDKNHAEELYTLLLPYAERNATVDIYVSYGPVNHYLGLLAELLGRVEDSRRHFRNAIESSERAEALLFLVQSLTADAAMLLKQKHDGSPVEAQARIDRGLALARSLGLTTCVSHLQALEGIRQTAGEKLISDGSTHELKPDSPARVGLFSLRGEYWTIGLDASRFPLKNIKGLGYIHRLLQHPGREFHALDLLSSAGAGSLRSDTLVGPEETLPVGITIRRGLTGDAGEMLDAQAKREYQHRLHELNEMLEDQRERGNHERADEIEGQIEFLTRTIVGAKGLGGRQRRTGSNAERARLSVTSAIKTAIEKISQQDAGLGNFLDRSIRTGFFCCYVPDPESPVTWQFSTDGVSASSDIRPTLPTRSSRDTKGREPGK